MMPHPVFRPRCGTCYGQGCVPAPWEPTDWLDCPHCHGQGFDPYWNGPDSPPFYATLDGGRYMGSDPLSERAIGAALSGSGGC